MRTERTIGFVCVKAIGDFAKIFFGDEVGSQPIQEFSLNSRKNGKRGNGNFEYTTLSKEISKGNREMEHQLFWKT